MALLGRAASSHSGLVAQPTGGDGAATRDGPTRAHPAPRRVVDPSPFRLARAGGALHLAVLVFGLFAGMDENAD